MNNFTPPTGIFHRAKEKKKFSTKYVLPGQSEISGQNLGKEKGRVGVN